MSGKKQEMGGRGEALAAAHLEKLGYRILARRWRCLAGELDLIAQDGDTVVFVEVRSRAPKAKVPPRANIGLTKQQQIVKVAQFYIRKHALRGRMRFDAIAIELDGDQSRIEHFPNAFLATGPHA